MKNRKCNTFVTDANPKFIRKIVERDKIDTTNTQIYDH
jgi:hypothetical protein